MRIDITLQEFESALTSNGFSRPSYDQYINFVSQLVSKGGITTKREAAMFLAQLIHESGGLQYRRELYCLSNDCSQAYPSTIGYPNKVYSGRGYIQLVINKYNIFKL